MVKRFVFVQLSDLGTDSWFKFRTDDCEINTSLIVDSLLFLILITLLIKLRMWEQATRYVGNDY